MWRNYAKAYERMQEFSVVPKKSEASWACQLRQFLRKTQHRPSFILTMAGNLRAKLRLVISQRILPGNSPQNYVKGNTTTASFLKTKWKATVWKTANLVRVACGKIKFDWTRPVRISPKYTLRSRNKTCQWNKSLLQTCGSSPTFQSSSEKHFRYDLGQQALFEHQPSESDTLWTTYDKLTWCPCRVKNSLPSSRSRTFNVQSFDALMR